MRSWGNSLVKMPEGEPRCYGRPKGLAALRKTRSAMIIPRVQAQLLGLDPGDITKLEE